MEICAQNRMPIINLTESGGADLPFQAEIFVPGGRGFRELTRRSAERIFTCGRSRVPPAAFARAPRQGRSRKGGY